MVKFFLGVLASLVAGALLFVGTTAYRDWRNDRENLVEYTVENDDIVVDEQLMDIVRNLDEGQQIATVTIENSGSGDIENPVFEIRSIIGAPIAADIIDFGVLSNSGERTENPSLERRDGSLAVEYPVLRPGEGSVIWIAHPGYEMFEIRNKQANLSVEEVRPGQIKDGGDAVWNILFYVLITLGSLILGMALSEWGNRHILKKVGFDPDEISELYRISEKSKSGSK